MKSYSKLTSQHNSRIRNSDMSDMISHTYTSMRYQYAIQSVPQSITHAKSAFRDYFGKQQQDVFIMGQRQIDNQGQHHKVNNNTNNNNNGSGMKRNIYAMQKQQLPTHIRNIAYNKLKHAFNLLMKVQTRQTTAKKTPTFNQKQSQILSSSQKVKQSNYRANAPQMIRTESIVEVPTNLVGRISKQSVSYVTSQMGSAPVSPSARSRTASKYRFIDNQIATFRESSHNFVILNKLMLLEDPDMFSEFRQTINSRNSVNVIKDTRLDTVNLTKSKNMRMFSILNQK